MILSWKDTTGKRRTKSISTGLPVKGNKKRAESLLRQTQKEFNPETMQQVCDLPVSEYFTRWLRESVMSLPPETYGRYAYACLWQYTFHCFHNIYPLIRRL